MAFVALNGVNVNYYDQGPADGCGVLFLHGWGSRFEPFRPFLDRIAEHGYRVCAPDLPGFGQSDEPPAAWDVDGYADFALDFLAGLNIKSAVLIGHSFGGRIIIKLAARENLPIKIPKIILIDSAGIRGKKTLRQTARVLFFKTVKRIVSIGYLQKK